MLAQLGRAGRVVLTPFRLCLVVFVDKARAPFSSCLVWAAEILEVRGPCWTWRARLMWGKAV